jgi:biotin carboxyl carrier protein
VRTGSSPTTIAGPSANHREGPSSSWARLALLIYHDEPVPVAEWPTKEPAIGLSIAELTILLNAFDESDWDEMTLAIDGTRVEITRGNGRAGSPIEHADGRAPAPGGHDVTAPSVGIFHRGAAPGAPPLVELGDDLGPGDVLGIVQAMRSTHQVLAGASGSVRAVHAEDGEPVEYGQLLLTIEGH